MTLKAVSCMIALLCAVGASAPPMSAAAETAAAPYPNMAPAAQYQVASRAEEIALARSAAPAAISNAATVLTLGAHGYETAATGTNGFVCIVERAWANDFVSNDFWNPKLRAPICFNAAAAHSVLPTYLQRTEWVLTGVSKTDIADRTRAAIAAGQIRPPELGAMCYMQSKNGYLGDDVHGPWHPHLMFFLPRTSPSAWGANVDGGSIYAFADGAEPLTVFLVPVPTWSDGTAAEMHMAAH
ncbi:MAG: hypothetical protein ABUL73_01415 [Alphaproteobacteria bacterium]